MYFDSPTRSARFGTTIGAPNPPLTQARAGHTATLLPATGTVLLTGGSGVTGILDSAELFDPVALTATALSGTLTTARTEHTGTLLPQTETLLIAGQDSLGPLFSTELFTPGTQTFRALSPNVQTLRASATATLLLDGRVLLTGGQSAGALSSVEGFNAQTVVLFKPSYDPEHGTFTVLPNGLVTARWDHAATTLADGRILMTGGRNDTGLLASTELFDPATETFTPVAAQMTTPRAGHSTTLMPDGRVILLGGESTAGALASAEVFTPTTQIFTALTPGLSVPRVNHTGTLLPIGQVLITGGQNSSGLLASTEFYTPQPADTTAPTVGQVSPSTGATGVDLTQIIGVRFSEPVDVRTLTATSVTLSGGASAVPATISPGESGLMVFLVPTAPLSPGTTYTVSLTANIKDTAGNALTPFTSQLTTVAAPTITSFTPPSGTAGTTVTISGTNFDPVANKNEVKFVGVLATVTAASAISLTVTVPSGATTGPITVTTRGGTATSATNFTVITTPPPTIRSFSPITGRVGDLVTILGTNFAPAPPGNTVRFGALVASVVSATPTQLVVTVPFGVATAALSVTTAGGTATSGTNFVPILLTTLTVTPVRVTLPVGQSWPLRATATFTDGSSTDVTSAVSWSSANSGTASVSAAGVAQGVTAGTATLSGSFLGFTASGDVQVTPASGETFPPDPATVAPPLTRTVATTLGDAMAFLYSGATPIQTGVAAGTLVATRAAGLRGLVTGRDGFPIPGVTITILHHPEFGQTRTRPDGRFDLAVNGGDVLTLTYAKPGYLSAHRQVATHWQETGVAPDVVLIPLDPAVTTVDLTLPTMQVARGSVVTDADGTRQATVLVAPGTTATMTLPGGGTQPLTTLHVRATEYTVGAPGPRAMPAELPPTSGYTYAAEFSVDEAQAAGATRVTFSQPVLGYLENVLALPIGTPVPLGVYDRPQGRWVPEPDGRVVKLLSVTGGLADVDTDGDGTADNTGLSSLERAQLAALYPPGQSLWRLPMTHFSPWDPNFMFGLPPDAIAALVTLVEQLQALLQSKDAACQAHSVIRCQEQTLGESVAVTGTPLRLHAQSDRAAGWREAYRMQIPLSGASLPSSLKRIELEVLIAGRLVTQSFPATPNQTTVFTWDGRDAYGRLVQGRQPVRVRVGYVYGAVYAAPAVVAQSFATYAATGAAISPNTSRLEVTLWREAAGRLGSWEAQGTGLGGWSVSGQHSYDPVSRMLLLGDGTRRATEPLGQTLRTLAGTGAVGFSGDGLPATSSNLFNPAGLAVGPDGSVYLADLNNNRIRRVAPDGLITTVAGTGAGGYNGDGMVATSATLSNPTGVAVGPDGSLYIADREVFRIRKVDPQGLISTLAGTGVEGVSPDGGLATATPIGHVRGIAVGPDGSVYVADTTNGRVRRVGPDGRLTSVLSISLPFGLAVGPEGSVYVASLADFRIRRVRPDGVVEIVAGGGGGLFSGDGGPAPAASLFTPFGVAVGLEGSVYIADRGNNRIRRVAPDGIITTFVGDGLEGFAGDGGLAAAGRLSQPEGVAVGPDGAVVIADTLNQRLRRVAPVLPGLAIGESAVPSEDGSEVYVFDHTGRHLRTVEAFTGAMRLQFAYDPAGRLLTITDADNNVTTIERNGTGNPTALVAPGGQRTTLTVHADGYLASITNPAGETVAFTYANEGLLATLTDARNHVHRYTYDADGRLTRDEDAAAGFVALSRTDSATGFTVSLASALNRTTSYQVERLTTGDTRLITTDPSGLATTRFIEPDGTRTITVPDGTLTISVDGPDPRWSMQAPLLKSLFVQTPGGLTSNLSTTRAVTLSNPADSLSLSSQTDTLVINGRTYTSTYTQATRLLSTTTPANRTSAVTLDAKGRVLQEQVAGLEPVAYTYDALGRLSTITQGGGTEARTSTLSYNTKNELISITDPLSRTVGFAYDLAGRITTQTLPDTRTIGYAYDANGNVTSITPPGKPAHTFSYTPVDLEADYMPPDVGFTPKNTTYSYNLDRQLTLVTRPDGQTLQLGYEPTGGRLTTLTLPGPQTLTYAYSPTTGNLSTITAPGSTLSYAYDGSLLTSTTWSGTVAGSVTRSYDNNFRITSQSVNGGNTIAFGYDTDSLLTSAGAETISRRSDNGLISGTSLGTISDERTYNPFGEVASYRVTRPASPVTYLDVAYTRDKLGRITQKAETLGGQTDAFEYLYDDAGRLREVKKNGGTTATYLYDSNGNRVSVTNSGGTVLGFYDNQDRLTQYGDLVYTYTANGELLTQRYQSTPNTTTSYVYDVLGNLKSATLPDGTMIEYVVDGQNRRIGKKVNGTLVQGWLYQNQLNPVAELDGTGAVVSRFVYGTKANVPDYVVKAGVTYRIVSDHLGSARLIVNTADGSIAQRMDYDEFGNVIVDTNPGFQSFGFAGGLYDQLSGLVRFGARDYDALTGRWTAKDPIEFRGRTPNLYGYVLNDPINRLDSPGLRLDYEQQLVVSISQIVGVTVGFAIAGGPVGAAVGGALAGAIAAAVVGGEKSDVAHALFEGALSGAFAGGFAKPIAEALAANALQGGLIAGGFEGLFHLLLLAPTVEAAETGACLQPRVPRL
ncbi:MAG: kelch repeat-containing protein [Nitrospiraceae bacterium]